MKSTGQLKTYRLALLAPVLLAALAWPQPAAAHATVAGFPLVKQWYSLSCEYAAAAAVTLYYGKLVSQRDFIAEVPLSPDPHLGFRGDINGKWGGTTDYGVYAEPLVPVLERRGYRAEVFYGPPARLQAELDAGRPVVVWMTGKRGDWPTTRLSFAGKNFTVTPYEHVVVVYGYDDGGVQIMDVGDGKRYYYGWSNFIARWDYFDQMALVMSPNW